VAASNAAGQRTAPCRFCGRRPGSGQRRMPGPVGPICVDCVQLGLWLVSDGQERSSEGGTALVRISALTASVCEYCGRRERRTFLGFRRPLTRMRCVQSDAVICVDCLDNAGELINRSYRH